MVDWFVVCSSSLLLGCLDDLILDWLSNWLVACRIERLIVCMNVWSVDLLDGWRFELDDRSVDLLFWLAGLFLDFLIECLVVCSMVILSLCLVWLVACLVTLLIVCLVDFPIILLIDLVFVWSGGRLIGWLFVYGLFFIIDCLMWCFFTKLFSCFWMNCWSIWLLDYLIDCPLALMFDWFLVRLVAWVMWCLVGCFIGWVFAWWAALLFALLFGGLIDCLIYCWIVWLADCLNVRLAVFLIGCLVALLID